MLMAFAFTCAETVTMLRQFSTALRQAFFMDQFITLSSFLFCTGLVAFLTYRMSRGGETNSSSGYFLGGRSLTAGFIAGSLMLTNLSTEQLVGLNGAAFRDGLSVMAWEVVAVVALVLMALFFLPKFLKSGITTVPEFLEVRFDRTTRLITTSVFVLAYAAILLPIILYTGAKGLNGMLDIGGLTGISDQSSQLWMTVWFVGLTGSIYAIFGGLKTVAISDTLNGIGLLIGGVLITYFGLLLLDDGGVFDAFSTLKAKHPGKMNSIGGPSNLYPSPPCSRGPSAESLLLVYQPANYSENLRSQGFGRGSEGRFIRRRQASGTYLVGLPGLIAFALYGDSIKADDAYGRLVRDALPAPLVDFLRRSWLGRFSVRSIPRSIVCLRSSVWGSTRVVYDRRRQMKRWSRVVENLVGLWLSSPCLLHLFWQGRPVFLDICRR